MLAPLAGRLIFTASANPRAASPADLAERVPAGASRAETAPTLGEALAMASAPPRPAVICVTGSLSLIGEALGRLGGDQPCPVEKGAATLEFPA